MKPSALKRIIFVNKRFQYKVISYFLGVTFCVLGVMWIAILRFFDKFVQMGLDMHLPAGHPFFRFIGGMRTDMNLTFLVVSVVATLIIVGMGAILSHRIAGPIYQLCKFMREAKTGPVTRPLSFRENDFFPEICDAVNPVLDELTERRKASSVK